MRVVPVPVPVPAPDDPPPRQRARLRFRFRFRINPIPPTRGSYCLGALPPGRPSPSWRGPTGPQEGSKRVPGPPWALPFLGSSRGSLRRVPVACVDNSRRWIYPLPGRIGPVLGPASVLVGGPLGALLGHSWSLESSWGTPGGLGLLQDGLGRLQEAPRRPQVSSQRTTPKAQNRTLYLGPSFWGPGAPPRRPARAPKGRVQMSQSECKTAGQGSAPRGSPDVTESVQDGPEGLEAGAKM